MQILLGTSLGKHFIGKKLFITLFIQIYFISLIIFAVLENCMDMYVKWIVSHANFHKIYQFPKTNI